MALDFDQLRETNVTRCQRWHDEGLSIAEIDTAPRSWSGADWSNAAAGEMGEAANVVKKLRRAETGVRAARDPSPEALVEMLGDEIADTITYLDLLANYYGIDLGAAIVRKFNAVSVREGFPERLASDSDVTPNPEPTP